jgi:hypothetical protein
MLNKMINIENIHYILFDINKHSITVFLLHTVIYNTINTNSFKIYYYKIYIINLYIILFHRMYNL